MKETDLILSKLPYQKPFLFVDELLQIDENGVTGTFIFDEKLDFYKGHFKDNPITPGVILIETMAQIGLVCLGIYLTLNEDVSQIAFSSSEVEFLKPVYPNEKVTVISEKVYFRFGKLKCKVRMMNNKNKEVCSGTLSGIIIK
ncbi:MAG TPA: 3-hydroxyacyl-ACP dehydratase FabZ family protein [Flavobacterium sp.]|uniref:3-hydroxyacyl-ACP dehydratase FabZ family protein n=1 Tax=unclassified Flavobacterium TaxID=196869 RepID=UPI000E9F2557|nr:MULTISPECIES: 3-hydroxyacyl-ACP dehydratase FabZ family protein [unclassified Flavobacterium]HBI01223.1 hydroxymyristoyl-ACP dehydratase [Flavobacterium sp.]HRE77949.1 3-hydroxyacyl-ACP dehydratase FabZ family protein [Flavobacterium sp.]